MEGGWPALMILIHLSLPNKRELAHFLHSTRVRPSPDIRDTLLACPLKQIKKRPNTSVELVESSQAACAFYYLHTPILSPHNWHASSFPSREISGDAYGPLYFHVRSLFFHLIGFSSHSMSRWQPGNGKWRAQIKTKGKKWRNREGERCDTFMELSKMTKIEICDKMIFYFLHFVSTMLRVAQGLSQEVKVT